MAESRAKRPKPTYDFRMLNSGAFELTEDFAEAIDVLREKGINYTNYDGTPLLLVTEVHAVSLKGSKGSKKSLKFTSNELQGHLEETGLISLENVPYTVEKGKEKGVTKDGVQPVNFKTKKLELEGMPEGVLEAYEIIIDDTKEEEKVVIEETNDTEEETEKEEE